MLLVFPDIMPDTQEGNNVPKSSENDPKPSPNPPAGGSTQTNGGGPATKDSSEHHTKDLNPIKSSSVDEYKG
jgi:hypothetical protein